MEVMLGWNSNWYLKIPGLNLVARLCLEFIGPEGIKATEMPAHGIAIILKRAVRKPSLIFVL